MRLEKLLLIVIAFLFTAAVVHADNSGGSTERFVRSTVTPLRDLSAGTRTKVPGLTYWTAPVTATTGTVKPDRAEVTASTAIAVRLSKCSGYASMIILMISSLMFPRPNQASGSVT